jgi:hypothetical protein
MNELRDKLSVEMEKLMVHIESEEDYEAIDELRNLINGRFSDDITLPKLFRDRILINKLNRLKTSSEDIYRKICYLSLQIKNKAKELKTEYRLLEKKKFTLAGMSGGIFGLIIAFPLFLYGLAFNFIFYEIPNLTLKKVKDEQFHGSVKYTISLFLALLFMPLYLILSFIVIRPLWLAILIFLSIPLTGLFAWSYYILFRRISGGLRIRGYIRKMNEDYLSLKENYEELLILISKLQITD